MGSPYRQTKVGEDKPVRVVIQMPKDEVDAIDLWGVPAGMPSRNAAVRRLLKDGLRASLLNTTNAGA